eukprot:5448253-Karenia_brevis.AAC.1
MTNPHAPPQQLHIPTPEQQHHHPSTPTPLAAQPVPIRSTMSLITCGKAKWPPKALLGVAPLEGSPVGQGL